MVFSSLPFLFGYLPLTLLAYFLTPLRWRNAVLLVVSLIFYGWGEPVYITIMFLSILIDYTHGILVEKYRDNDKKARRFVAQSVIFNLLLLGFFKYGTFLADNLYLLTGIQIPESVQLLGLTIPLRNVSLPIGISFYTFQTMSYTIDVYRRDAPVQRNMVDFGAFVTMFPQLIAGPIVQYKTVAAELVRRVHSSENFALGARRFCVGLAKKVLLANAIGALWEDCLAAQGSGELTVLGGWMGLFAFGFQIYFDFSGYSDMAIGLGRIFGFRFNENFDYPYLAASVTEFWRRWHITLGRWFRDYVYIPLGGSRKGRLRTMFNLFAVWILTALWHGAGYNFLIWGGMLLGALFLEKLFLLPFLQKSKVIGHVYLLLFVPVTWMAFTITDVQQLGIYLTRMFPFVNAHTGMVNSMDYIKYLKDYDSLLAMGVLFATPVPAVIYGRIKRGMLGTLAIAVIFALSMYYLAVSANNPFLYFNF